MSVTGGGLHLENALLDREQEHIESASTEIEDEDVPLASHLLVEAVGDGSSGRLVNDTEDVETGDGTGVLRGLTMRVVELGGNGDNGVVDGGTEVRLSNFAHLAEDHGGDLLRGLQNQLDRRRKMKDRGHIRIPWSLRGTGPECRACQPCR